jgi:hypothetical protein
MTAHQNLHCSGFTCVRPSKRHMPQGMAYPHPHMFCHVCFCLDESLQSVLISRQRKSQTMRWRVKFALILSCFFPGRPDGVVFWPPLGPALAPRT